jgi:putative hemolysin
MDAAPCVMREIGRLRELTFRTVGEGCGQPRDIDRFDRHYEQLVLWDDDDMEIVGAYRLADAGAIIREQGVAGLYSSRCSTTGPGAGKDQPRAWSWAAASCSRSYQTRHSLDYLWYGIGAYIKANPHIRYLFGPASISRFYGTRGHRAPRLLLRLPLQRRASRCPPRTPFHDPAGDRRRH